MSVEPWF